MNLFAKKLSLLKRAWFDWFEYYLKDQLPGPLYFHHIDFIIVDYNN